MIGANVNFHLHVRSAVIGGKYLWKRLSGSERGWAGEAGGWGGHRQESMVTVAVTWSGQHAELLE